MFIDGPGLNEPLAAWQAWLQRLNALPASQKAVRDAKSRAQRIIKIKKAMQEQCDEISPSN